MIEVFEGRLGGGKSYSAVARILAHLAQGGYVFTNITLNWDACVLYCRNRYKVELQDSQYVPIDESDLSRFNEKLPRGSGAVNILCVLDEIHLWFNSRDWANASRDLLAYLTQSRKVRVDLIFISQSMNNIDKQFVRLVQYIWRFRDMQRFVFPVLGFRWPFAQILGIHYDYDGKTCMGRYWVKKDPAVFACYDTNSLLKPIKFAGDELPELILDKAQRKQRFTWKTLKPFLIAGLFIVILSVKLIFDL